MRSGDFNKASQLSRKRPLIAKPRDDSPPCRTTQCSVARAKCSGNGGRICTNFAERPLGDPALRPARRAIDLVLAGHEPYPAFAVDRHWTLVASNKTIAPLVAGASPELMRQPINVLRLGLHPNGMAPRITNFPEWRSHLIARLRHQIYVTADPILKQLMSEILSYPMPRKAAKTGPDCEEYTGVVLPLQLSTEDGTLSFLVRRPCLEHRSILHWRTLLLSLSFRQTPRPQSCRPPSGSFTQRSERWTKSSRWRQRW